MVIVGFVVSSHLYCKTLLMSTIDAAKAPDWFVDPGFVNPDKVNWMEAATSLYLFIEVTPVERKP